MGRLTALHINIIGVIVAIIVAAGLYFTLITGAKETIQKNQTEYDRVAGEAAKYDQAKRNLANAQAAQAKAQAQYAAFEQKYMPIFGYTADRTTTMMKVFWPNRGRSWPERFIRAIRQHMARERKTNNIVWQNPGVIQLGPYGPNPNAIDAGMPGEGLGDNGYLHYTFPMTVRGPSMAAIMRHIRSWPAISGVGVPVVEGLTLSGNSPSLIASYNLTLTILVHEPIPPPDNRIGGSQAGGAGGGMMGRPGMPGGMSGGMTAPPMGGGMTAPPMGGGPPMMMSPGMAGPPAGAMGGPPGMSRPMAGGMNTGGNMMGGPARGGMSAQ